MTELTDADREILSQVLEPRLNFTRKNGPRLSSLSLYSSELKGLPQTYTLLKAIHQRHIIPASADRSRIRYFRTLSNNGLVEGSPTAPTLTAVGEGLRATVEAAEQAGTTTDSAYYAANGHALELPVVRALVERMRSGESVAKPFLEAWFNAQTFVDCVPADELAAVISDEWRLLRLFQINSVGWEVARYFRLDLEKGERAQFDAAQDKILASDFEPLEHLVDKMAKRYHDAWQGYQADVRFRIKNFLGAFTALQAELGDDFPRLSRDLALNRSVSATVATSGPASGDGSPDGENTSSADPLPHPHQIIISGCPGSGKSFQLESMIERSGAKVFRTQFHPETSYYDFVGAYRPQPVYEGALSGLVELDSTAFARGKPMIDYRFVAGPLTKALVYALRHPEQNVVVQIEELNRGNPAAIFGDVLQLLDRDETGQSRYAVSPTMEHLAHVRSATGIELEELRLPSNLYLWATMNSADQGVYPIDSAFRRRWSYVYMGYSLPCKYEDATRKIFYGGETYDWDGFRDVLNTLLVELNVHEDKLIGPYFLTKEQLASPDDVLQKLFLYLWDDVLRFRQSELFFPRSFSEVATQWRDGAGGPLKLTERLNGLAKVTGLAAPSVVEGEPTAGADEQPAQA